MAHTSLESYYKINFALMQHHKYSLTELENMIPWERKIYVGMLNDYIKEENSEIKELDAIIPNNSNEPYDMCDVINLVFDDDLFELQPHWAKNIITGFESNGFTVGSTVVRNGEGQLIVDGKQLMLSEEWSKAIFVQLSIE